MSIIYCACGCGQQLEEIDKWKRRRKFILGHNRRGMINSKEANKKISDHNKGKPSPKKGIKIKIIKNELVSCLCGCGEFFEKFDFHGRIRKYIYGHQRIGIPRTEKEKENISKGLKGQRHSKKTEFKYGETHWNWKGGVSSLNNKIRNSDKYKEWRLQIFNRDGFICQECRIKNKNLAAHHIERFSIIMNKYNINTLEQALSCDILWNLNNGITLCEDCHKKTDTYLNKKGEKC